MEPTSEPERGGVFISRGAHLRLSNFSISVGPDGVVASQITLGIAYDLWPLWLRIAVQHERLAVQARQRLVELTGDHDDRHAAALAEETTAGMVTIAAAGFAIDAFYGAVKGRIDDPPPRGRRSRRYALIAETLKRAFVMSQRSSNTLRAAVRQVFRFRDMGVHPTGDFRDAIQHPVMGSGVAFPHIAFRVENAQAAVEFVLSLIEQCAAVPKARHRGLVEWCRNIPETVEELRRLRDST